VAGLVIVGLVILLFLGLRSLLRTFFAGVDPTVSAAIVAAVATTLVSVATLVLNRTNERKKAVEQEIRASKIPVYSKLIKGLLDTLLQAKKPGGIKLDAFGRMLEEITPQLVTWASDEVIVAWSRYKRRVGSGGLTAAEAIFEFEALLLAIRKDVGHSNRGMASGDLLRLFITDVDEHLPTAVK
jgi:hypothetical protein